MVLDPVLLRPEPAARVRPTRPPAPPAAPRKRNWRPWLLWSLVVVGLAVVFVIATEVRPAYDAYGWLIWAREALHWSLDTTSAPSWKPLTFLFTFPYTLVLGDGALYAWMVTAVAAAFAAPVFAGRIAYRLTAAPDSRRFAAPAAAAFAGAGVLGIEGYFHFVLTATADPMMVALCLAAIDCLICHRFRWAWLMLVLVCLGRPEVSPMVLIYAVWAWRRLPAMRALLVGGLGAIALLWFGIPRLTSGSWFNAGDVLGASTSPLQGNKFVAVFRGLLSLYELPMEIAAGLALLLAISLRERVWLLLAAGAAAWMAMDVALAMHGWGVAPRYMMEPAAVMIVLVAVGVGRLLAFRSSRFPLLRWPALAAVLALVALVAPHGRMRARLLHNGIVLGRTWARQIDRLQRVIVKRGGVARVLSCGQPVTTISFQSIVAWELGRNVVAVGWQPPRWIAMRIPIVLFQPYFAGWQLRPLNTAHSGNPATARPPGRTLTTRERLNNRVLEHSLQTFFTSGAWSHPGAYSRHAAARRAAACTSLTTQTASN